MTAFILKRIKSLKNFKIPNNKRNKYFYINEKIKDGNRNMFESIFFIYLLSFFLLFSTSICQEENVIYLREEGKRKRTIQVIGSLFGVEAMIVNDETIEPSTRITVTQEINYFKIVYSNPLINCSKILYNSRAIYADLTQFDSSQCTSFKMIFQECDKLTSLKLGNKFLTSNAVDMSDMFNQCGANNFNYFIDFSKFITSKVRNMDRMFKDSNFKFLDLRSFDTSEVTTMEEMFSGCGAISIDLTNFDTSKVINMQGMFSNVNNLISLDISNFNFDKGEKFTRLFYNMNGNLKLCLYSPIDPRIQKEILEAQKVSNCENPCFHNSINKFVDREYCVESCQETIIKTYEYDNECFSSCPNGKLEHPQNSLTCIDIINCSTNYYSYDMTECIDEVPEGFYCNNNTKKTTDKCPNKCKTCNFESVQNQLCESCNISNSYFPAENHSLNINNYIDCFNITPEGYYLDSNDKIFKKCYKTCKNCDSLGNDFNHQCNECPKGYFSLNNSNCYKKCEYYYYFDSQLNYFCTPNEQCPLEKSKLILETKECVESCSGTYKYDFKNICYTTCPQGTYYDYNQTGCLDKIPVGFYLNDTIKRTIDKCDIKCEKDCILDESTNKIFCKKCNEEKNYFKIENGIEKNGYYDCSNISNKDILINNLTCPENSPYLIKEKNECVDSCNGNKEYSFSIPSKKECISDCTKDEKFKFDFRKECFEDCPKNTRTFNNSNYHCEIICNKDEPFELINSQECVSNCSIYELSKNICIVNYKDDNSEIEKEIVKNIEQELIEEFNISILGNGEEFSIEKKGFIYILTTTEKQKEILNLMNNGNNNETITKNNFSVINLGECETNLKNYYNISENNSLYIFKIDIYQEGFIIPKVEYVVYYPLNENNLKKLNLSICQNNRIELYFPLQLVNKEEIEKYNSSSDFYNDICSIYTSEKGTDVILKDRRQEFIKNNKSLCEENCILDKFGTISNTIMCSCDIKSNLTSLDKINLDNNTLINNFKNIKSFLNLNFLACYNIVFKKGLIKNNIGFFIGIVIIALQIFCIFYFYVKEYTIIEKEINEITLSKINIQKKYKFFWK